MAREALLIDETGNAKLVQAAELTDDDRNEKFICCGITTDKGLLCGADMGLSIETPNKSRHFYLKTANSKHRPCCPMCRERAASLIAKLDQSGTGTTDEELFNRMNQDKKVRPKSKMETPPADVEDNDPNEKTESLPEDEQNVGNRGDTEKEIRVVGRHPRSFEEYVALLRSLSTNKQYANRRVYDLILDERTVEGYRRFDAIPQGRPFVITARKMVPPDGVFLQNHQWMLKDFWGKNGKEFFFILNLDEDAKQKLWNLCNITPAAQIRVWAVFRKHPTLPRTYISDLVKPQMIIAEMTTDSMQDT